MNIYDMTGSVKVIFEPQTFASGFSKREFVVTTEENYPQDIKFECIKEWCGLLDPVGVGDRVQVRFRLRGNEYNDRYFVNLQAIELDKLDETSGAATSEMDDSVPEDAEDDSYAPPF